MLTCTQTHRDQQLGPRGLTDGVALQLAAELACATND